MSEITLEKIDILKERTGVSYKEAKEALEYCNGDVVEALIYLESSEDNKDIYTTKEEFINWIKDLVKKGQATRIRIKKEEKTIVDIPLNAGVAVGVMSLVWLPIAATLLVTAMVTKVTIEITKTDGTVEVVNKIIKTKTDEVKDIIKEAGNGFKDKFNCKMKKDSDFQNEDNIYQYTVNFHEDDEKDKNDEQ
ncbi:DUF4342 domain-containing protein [Haloimpatiens sp. FM7315]|uniref:DUF4342 domain-containing protein n=1 Tax=Haloimpatiens sp. FM7315 TaxID=3298609 RepID=UPI0035A2CE29